MENNQFKESQGEFTDPLALEIDDKELVKIVDERISAMEKYYANKLHLKDRRDKNEKYLFGRQIDQKEKEGKIKDYEARSSDNVLYEIEASIKPLALSKLPDMIVTPGVEGDEKREKSAKDVSLAINDMNKKREMREAFALGFKHLPVYFTGVVKARWDQSKGKYGEMVFENVHPEHIMIDQTATTKRTENMKIIVQIVPSTVQELFMKFPKKKKELMEELALQKIAISENPTWKELATEVNYYEVWFDWYRRKDNKDILNQEYMSQMEPGVKWEKITCVLWKYKNCLLDKMLDPNYDHEGEEKMFIYGTPGDEATKQEVPEEMLMMMAMTGQQIPGVVTEKIYHNYFSCSQKPYYFFGYDQWGKHAIDETSRIEQNIRNQENLDDQNKSVVDQLKKRLKHIWSKDSGMDKKAVQELDLDDDRTDALVEGDPNKVHAAIQPERPDAAQYKGLQDKRDRMYAISGATAVRGNLQSDVATSNQIAREADFTRADDLVEDTINSAYEWAAGWQMQFIKLRYTEEHMQQILGASGLATYVKLRRDSISDGMEVKIKSSSTDRLKAQRNAMETAGLGPPFTNPIDFFKDMDLDDPEGRTERGLMFMSDPAGYYAKYVMGLEGTEQMAGALNGGIPSAVPPGPGQSPQQPMSPQGATPADTSVVASTPPMMPQASPRGM